MGMAELYEYRTAGRSPLAIACYGMALALVLFSARGGAGLWLWSLWAFLTAALAHQLLAHPTAGSRLDTTSWTYFVDRRRRTVPLDRVRQVTLHRCRGCRCACTLTLTDGTRLRLPRVCLPPPATLAKALRRRGLKVVIERPKPAERPPIRAILRRAAAPLD